jgi:hypothetical protein
MLRLFLATFPMKEIEVRLFKSQERKIGPKIPLKIKKMKNISAQDRR